MQNDQRQTEKLKAEGAIKALNMVKESLCHRELTYSGRVFIDKLITEYQDDINRIENEADKCSNRNRH